MFFKSLSSGIEGIEGYIVNVEADVSKEFPTLPWSACPILQ